MDAPAILHALPHLLARRAQAAQASPPAPPASSPKGPTMPPTPTAAAVVAIGNDVASAKPARLPFLQALAQTGHNFESMLEGKSTFNQFVGEEGALIEAEIGALPPVISGAAQVTWDAVKAGASVLVGAGETAIGPILNETSDEQAAQVANLLSLVGVSAVGPLSLAEHAALVTLINGLKTGLDRIGLHIALARGVDAGPQPAAK